MLSGLFVVNVFILVASLALVLFGAHFAIHFSSRIARHLGIARYVVGFLMVAVISVLPETFIALMSAREGVASFGLATLFGSNVADLTFVIAVVLFANGRSIQVESRVLKNNEVYITSLLLPIFLGIDGVYSRFDGALLLGGGILIHWWLYRKHRKHGTPVLRRVKYGVLARNFFFLSLCMACILIGSHYTVHAGGALAMQIGISPVLIGLLIVGLGTTLPELFFSLSALKKHHDSLALGDIIGTVITDATAVVGIVALVSPFSFHPKIVSVTGMFMLAAGIILFYFMWTGKRISRREGLVLFILYALFVCVEVIAAKM